MTHLRPEMSFVATIKCQVEGLEGFLDVNTVSHTAGGKGGRLEQSTDLVANNYYNYPEVDASQRCNFHFRALETPQGGLVYNICAKVGDEGLEVAAETRKGNIFLTPYLECGGRLEFWHFRSVAPATVPDAPGKYAGIWLERYIGVAEEEWRRRMGAEWPAGTGFYAHGRTDSGPYWNARFTAQAGPDRIPFLADLYVNRVGLYDLLTMEPIDLEEFRPAES